MQKKNLEECDGWLEHNLLTVRLRALTSIKLLNVGRIYIYIHYYYFILYIPCVIRDCFENDAKWNSMPIDLWLHNNSAILSKLLPRIILILRSNMIIIFAVHKKLFRFIQSLRWKTLAHLPMQFCCEHFHLYNIGWIHDKLANMIFVVVWVLFETT